VYQWSIRGPKGYCAAAVAERLLRYFGKEVDQHENRADGGTRLRAWHLAAGHDYGIAPASVTN